MRTLPGQNSDLCSGDGFDGRARYTHLGAKRFFAHFRRTRKRSRRYCVYRSVPWCFWPTSLPARSFIQPTSTQRCWGHRICRVRRRHVCRRNDRPCALAALAAGGPAALPLLWVVFWFLVGAGRRDGQRMPGLSCAVALVGIMCLMHWQPWQRADITAGLGVALSVLAISLYLALLVNRLENRH